MFPSPRNQPSAPTMNRGASNEDIGAQVHGVLQSQGLLIRNNNGNNNGLSTTYVFSTPGTYNISIRHQMVLPGSEMTAAQRRMANDDGNEESSSSSPWIYPRTPSPSPSPRRPDQLTFEDFRRAGRSGSLPGAASNEIEMTDDNGTLTQDDSTQAAPLSSPPPLNSQLSQNASFGSQSSARSESLLQPVPYYRAASLGSPGSEVPDVYNQWHPSFFDQY